MFISSSVSPCSPLCPSRNKDAPRIPTAHFMERSTGLPHGHRDRSWPTWHLSAETLLSGVGKFTFLLYLGRMDATCLCGRETGTGSFWFGGRIHLRLCLSLRAEFRWLLCNKADDRFCTRPSEGGNKQMGSSVPAKASGELHNRPADVAVPREASSSI